MKKIKLFPRKTKYYGIALMLLSPFIMILLLKLGIVTKNDKWMGNILQGLILLGALMIILSKEKIEDEFIDSCRLIAFRFSFIFGVGVYITAAFIFDEKKTGFELLLGQVILYFITFYSLKSGLIKYDK